MTAANNSQHRDLLVIHCLGLERLGFKEGAQSKRGRPASQNPNKQDDDHIGQNSVHVVKYSLIRGVCVAWPLGRRLNF